ncbi:MULTISPECIES: hypothetical protein [Streptomyces]|uniref:hypothetical protein n=1 Tax=Streptomyces TaxID=1883 RepID=UPI0012FF0707|nr:MULTISPECIES: hypothetical protein [Streptomyces]
MRRHATAREPPENAAVADRVIVMDKGRIVQTGTWAELAEERDGLFRELLDLQRDRTVPAQRAAGEES